VPGPQGDIGPQGSQGEAGATGPAGPRGAGLGGFAAYLPGEYLFTVPAGVTRLHVELWGGGGGGGGGIVDLFLARFPGGGGNGGAYVRAIVEVNPGETYRVVVGDGGAGNAWGDGARGGDTFMDSQAPQSPFSDALTLLYARGGAGGYHNVNASGPSGWCPFTGDDAWNNSSRVKFFMGLRGLRCNGSTGAYPRNGMSAGHAATPRAGVFDGFGAHGGYGGCTPVTQPPGNGGSGWAFLTW
jgi:hypothetical protein